MIRKTLSPLVEENLRAQAPQVLIDNMLTESSGVTIMNVLEESKNGGALVVEGKVGQCGVPTANRRLYERQIMEREIGRLQEKIERNAALAAVDHPGDGKSRIREAGAICRGLRVENDGSIWGKYEIVEDSSGGKDLAAFLRRGAAIGMSSRGLGSTRLDSSGNHVVGEDFKLHGFDFVADPACRDAFPTLVSESIDPDEVTENELRVRFPTLVKSIEERAQQAAAEVVIEEAESKVRTKVEEEFKLGLSEARETLREQLKLEVYTECRQALRDDFSAKLLKAIQGAKTEALEIARSELLSDPKVAGAKKFMEDLASQLVPYHPDPERRNLMDQLNNEVEALKSELAARDAALEEAQAMAESRLAKAQNLGKRLYLERTLKQFENSEQIAKLVGNVDEFQTVDELAEAIKVVAQQVAEAEEVARARAAEIAKINEHKAEIASTKSRLLEDQLERVRTEFADRIEKMTENLRGEIREKDDLLNEAASEIEELRRKLEATSKAARNNELEAYALKRTVGHPRQADILSAVHSGRVSSVKAINQLAESLETRAAEPGGPAERVRRSLGRGREAPTEEDYSRLRELSESSQPVPGLESFDTTMGELRALAGIDQNGSRRRF